MIILSRRVWCTTLCLAALLAVGAAAQAQDQQQLLDRIKQLEEKVATLEGKSTQVVMQASVASTTLDFLNQVNVSGFVSGSYFYDFSKGTAGGANPMIAGRLFDANNNSFIPDKFKLTLEKPVDFSPTNWNVGFRADLIAGKDAELIHSTGLFGGPGSSQSIDLEQAYVKFNVPIGNGLTVLFGKHVTMMGVEVVEEVNNPNWSIGNQFIYEENTTETGVLLAYKWNDKWETDFCAVNGWDQVTDVNASKTFMGRIGFTPDDKTSLSLLGYGGPEQPNDNHDYRTGADIVFNRNKLFTDKLNVWLQLDYGHEDNAPQADLSTTTPTIFPNSDWYGAGGWLTYDFTDKVELALRSDYVKDKHGVRTPFVDGLGGTGNTITTPATFTVAPKELYGETVTLNFKPVANLQIRPEVRYDRAAAGTAFNGKKDQITAGVGVAYLY